MPRLTDTRKLHIPQDCLLNSRRSSHLTFASSWSAPAYSRGPLVLDRAGYLMERGDASGQKDGYTRLYA